MHSRIAVVGTILCATNLALAGGGEIVVPNNAPSTAGTGGSSTLLNAQPRSYQLVVGPQELTTLPLGARISGITWRRPSWQVFANWPGTATCVFNNYDIFLSTSLNPPGSLSTNYLQNIGPDMVQTRAGSISMSGAFFPGGALAPNVNPFGTIIPFSTTYVYRGGHLLLTVRHDGNNCGGSGSLDTVPSPHTQAIGVSSYTQPDNWYAQGLIVMKLTYLAPCTGDVDNSGSVNVNDLLTVINGWGGCPGACPPSCPADANFDCQVNVNDLLAVINAWGACPGTR